MKISHDGTTISFKTEPQDLFEAEKSGAKSNTVRILDNDEYQQLKKGNAKKIIIQYQQEVFLRTLTHIHLTEYFFGRIIAIFSWANEKHHHPISNEDPDPKAHTMSLGEVTKDDHGSGIPIFSIAIAKTVRCPTCEGHLLKSRAGEFGKCAICQALFRLDLEEETPEDGS